MFVVKDIKAPGETATASVTTLCGASLAGADCRPPQRATMSDEPTSYEHFDFVKYRSEPILKKMNR